MFLQPDKLQRLGRALHSASRRRVGMKSLLYKFRPRYGDLVAGFFCLWVFGVSAIHAWYPGGWLKFAEHLGPVPGSYAAPITSLQSFPDIALAEPTDPTTRRYLRLTTGNTLFAAFEKEGLIVDQAKALSEAFAQIYDNALPAASAKSRDLPLLLELEPHQTGWKLLGLSLELSPHYRIHFTAHESFKGQWAFLPAITRRHVAQRQFLISGNAREVLQGRYLLLHAEGRQRTRKLRKALDRTNHIHDILLFLDRNSAKKGGLAANDRFLALFSYPGHNQPPRLHYIRLTRADSSQEDIELVFQNEQALNHSIVHSTNHKNLLYDLNGKAWALSDWGEPLIAAEVTSNFGMRLHPIKKFTKLHEGIDYSAPIGTPVRSVQPGVVLRRGYQRTGYGHFIEVKHKNGFSTLYAHLKQVRQDLKAGNVVQKGEIIGQLGNSGLSTGPHLHYEIRYNGEPLNPVVISRPELRLPKLAERTRIGEIMHHRRSQVAELIAELNQ